VNVTATTPSGGRQHFLQRVGMRSLQVVGGRLLLNGHPVNLRGVGIHEDSPTKGAAIDNSDREQQIQWARELGATVLRAHYPLHPYTEERADELGLLLWSEIPMYSLKTNEVDRKSVRDYAAGVLRQNILMNGSHPSIIVWSIGNELSSKPDAGQTAYIRDQVSLAHALDPSRPVGIAVAGYPSAGCQSGYGPLQVIGLNDYFGWYPGPSGQIADRTLLSDYLDHAHACYANKALFVTEFGAEANRDGPAEERGTYQFQQDFVNYQLGVFATKPWLNGAIYWTLQEFRVRPNWEGGNPHPNSPLHQKGLITFDGQRKPAFFDVQRDYRAQSPLR
jgi:beta-glucuronidase